MRKQILSTLFLSLTLFLNMNTASAQENRNIFEYNLNDQGQGFINGQDKATAKAFDPVSSFSEGGSKPVAGNTNFAHTYEGVDYLFVSAANRKTFMNNPTRFEPTYGGYCARAMIVGQKVHIDTRHFTVIGNRAFYFVGSRAKRFFDRDIAGNAKIADQKWEELSGESPRL